MKKNFTITVNVPLKVKVTYSDFLKTNPVKHFEFETKGPSPISPTGYHSHFERSITLLGLTPERYAQEVCESIIRKNI